MLRIIVTILALGLGACGAPTAVPGPPPARQIALTYDDAPRGDGATYSGEARADLLIAAFAEADVVAGFFVTTQSFGQPGRRARVERYAAAGHLIANHSHTHPWASQTDVDVYLADIAEAQSLLDGTENLRPWFRYPFLDEGRTRQKRDAIREGLSEMGLSNGYVTVDNYDWYINGKWAEAVKAGQPVDEDALGQVYVDMALEAAAFYDEVAVEALGRSPAHVLLLHENDLAARFTPRLIAAFEEAGWEIVDPDTAYADPIAAMIPDIVFGAQGRVAAIAAEKGRARRTIDPWVINKDQIDARLSEAGVFGPAE